MGYKVILSPEAIQRLEQIVRVIARDNPDVARRFGFKLLDRTDLLSNFPELGREYRKRPGVRRLLCNPYFIYYPREARCESRRSDGLLALGAPRAGDLRIRS